MLRAPDVSFACVSAKQKPGCVPPIHLNSLAEKASDVLGRSGIRAFF